MKAIRSPLVIPPSTTIEPPIHMMAHRRQSDEQGACTGDQAGCRESLPDVVEDPLHALFEDLDLRPLGIEALITRIPPAIRSGGR